MADMLQTSTNDLSTLIASMSREERFSKMKQFYLKMYPQTKAFYENYGKQKRNIDELSKDDAESSEIIKQTPDEETTQKEAIQIDYYENMTTFENVLDLIEPYTTSDAESTQKEKEEHEVDEMFLKYMKHDSSSRLTQNPVSQATPSGLDSQDEEKANDLLQKFLEDQTYNTTRLSDSQFQAYISPVKSTEKRPKAESSFKSSSALIESPRKAARVEKSDQYWDTFLDEVAPIPKSKCTSP